VTIEEYINRNGTKTLGLFVEEFIRKAPEFDGDQKLVVEIGRMMDDLDSVFAEHEKNPKGQGK